MGSSCACAVDPGMMLALGKLSHGNVKKKSPVGGKSRLLATSTGHVRSVGGGLYSTSRVFSINIYTQTGANTMCRVKI